MHPGPVKIGRIVLALVMLAAAVVVAALYLHRQHDRGTPYRALVPERNVLALTARAGKVCQSSDGLPTPNLDKLAPRVWVDPDPVGGVVLWRPGPRSRPCKARLEHLDPRRAQTFAVAVEKAPLPSVHSCPPGDGSGATVFLTYRGKQDAEVVRISLLGCGRLSAPERLDRETGDALAALGPAPAGLR